MDRAIVYSGALPQTTDILNTNKFGQVGLAYALRGILGTATAVHNLAVTPTSPASLQVTVGVGAIYTLDTMDATAYSDLGLDQHQVVKQGLLQDPVTLTITPPATSGFSQVYLVEAILSDIDSGTSVLPYLNAANPSQPFSGPANNGMSQFTQRTVQCTIALKAGTPAATGSQVNPTPDAGYTGLYFVTVANGQTQITGGNIVLNTAAPYFPTLPSVPNGVQTNLWTYCVDTGTVNVMAATVYPPLTQLVPGTGVLLKVANGNTGAATFNLNGLGAQPVHRANGSALSSGDLNANELVALVWDGSAWQTLNFFGFTASSTNNNTFIISIPFAVDSGSINSLVGNFTPVITTLAAGQTVEIQVSNTNTGDSTLVCNALGSKGIRQNGFILQPRALVAGQIVAMVFDGTFFQIINARWPYYTFDTSAPPGADIPMAIGDQVTVTFTNATLVPLKVATLDKQAYEITLVNNYPIPSPPPCSVMVFLMPNNAQQTMPPTDPNWFFHSTHATSSDPSSGPLLTDSDGTLPLPAHTPFAFWFAEFGLFNNLDGRGLPQSLTAYNGLFGMFLHCQMELWSGQGQTALGLRALCGPFITRAIVSTSTGCKQVAWRSGTLGGPSTGYSRWFDTVIPWTSLGSMGTGAHTVPVAQATPMTGSVTVKRLA